MIIQHSCLQNRIRMPRCEPTRYGCGLVKIWCSQNKSKNAAECLVSAHYHNKTHTAITQKTRYCTF